LVVTAKTLGEVRVTLRDEPPSTETVHGNSVSTRADETDFKVAVTASVIPAPHPDGNSTETKSPPANPLSVSR
jgi:hypothetical protein